MFLKLIKTTVFLTPAALLCITIGHIYFNQCWDIVTECLHIDEDGLPEFNLQRAVDIAHAARGAKNNENKYDESTEKDDDKDDEAEDDTHEDVPSAGKASTAPTKQLLRHLLGISRKMSFPGDITWPPAVEMDCDFAGKGYSRSLYGSVAKKLGNLESGFPQVPGKGKMKLPYVPRLMLYLVYYSKICQAARLMKHWQEVTQYLHHFFFVSDQNQLTFCFFCAKRALDYVIDSIQGKHQFGLSIDGFLGTGAVGTVDKLYGRPITALGIAKGGYNKEAFHLYHRFKELHGERIEEAGRAHLGVIHSFSLVTLGGVRAYPLRVSEMFCMHEGSEPAANVRKQRAILRAITVSFLNEL